MRSRTWPPTVTPQSLVLTFATLLGGAGAVLAAPFAPWIGAVFILSLLMSMVFTACIVAGRLIVEADRRRRRDEGGGWGWGGGEDPPAGRPGPGADPIEEELQRLIAEERALWLGTASPPD